MRQKDIDLDKLDRRSRSNRKRINSIDEDVARLEAEVRRLSSEQKNMSVMLTNIGLKVRDVLKKLKIS